MPRYLVHRTIQGLTKPRERCFEGNTVEVSEEAAAHLVKSGSLTLIPEPEGLPSTEDLDAVAAEQEEQELLRSIPGGTLLNADGTMPTDTVVADVLPPQPKKKRGKK
jgi:hypothetical protein